MGSFTADIAAFVKKTGIKADLVLKKLGFQALEGVLLMSPVRTGRFRGSWRVSLTAADLSFLPPNFNKTLDTGPIESARAAAAAAGQAKIASARFGMTIILSNNVPYAKRLERGYSKQAPSGVVGPTFIRLVSGLNKIVSSI